MFSKDVFNYIRPYHKHLNSEGCHKMKALLEEMSRMDEIESKTRAWTKTLVGQFSRYYNPARHQNVVAVRRISAVLINEDEWLQAVAPDLVFPDVNDIIPPESGNLRLNLAPTSNLGNDNNSRARRYANNRKRKSHRSSKSQSQVFTKKKRARRRLITSLNL